MYAQNTSSVSDRAGQSSTKSDKDLFRVTVAINEKVELSQRVANNRLKAYLHSKHAIGVWRQQTLLSL